MDLRGLIGRQIVGVELAYDPADCNRVVGVLVKLDSGEELSVGADVEWEPVGGASRVIACLRIAVKAKGGG
jgi:hypothetical protein